MKRVMLLGCFLFTALVANAQMRGRADWTFSAKKIKPGYYEVHMSAEVEDGWNIYSQWTPKGGPEPTVIKFTPNANVLLGGKVKEVGFKRVKHEEVFGVDVHYFNGKVDFVQVIKLKVIKPDALKGKINYMTCDKSQCISAEVEFNIPIK